MSYSLEMLTTAYYRMRLIRIFEDRLHVEFQTGDIPGFIHLYAGQEACAVGCTAHFKKGDWLLGTHRGHGPCLATGADVTKAMLEIYGREGGLCGGRGGTAHLHDHENGFFGAQSGVGSAAGIANGIAFAARSRGEDIKIAALCGDAAFNQGIVQESLNLGAVMKLPVVTVVENNGYGQATGSSWALAGGCAANRAKGVGIPGITVDGADFFAVYDAMGEAFARASRGEGGSIVEVAVKRFYGHFEGEAQTYRAPGEIEDLRENHDCLKSFRQRVTDEGWLTDEALDTLDQKAQIAVDEAHAACMQAAPVTADDMFDHVYSSPY